ncbi:helix-turn-helix transcriptional regulator [Streptomyces sp. HD]|uniref:helix-turn-helix transcriptional regulator n=1 Tax=Streptomyces sp. HD TaxID=3020892 RepID=UPI002330DE6C|nr:AAA family ATPase [Streptomyces sp. HD]MDC0771521.1 AAA family ATPase [Streptomyces sp. HD]
MLHERQNELKVAAEALRLAVQGSGSLVVISGPPGIGKSAVLNEIGELATRLTVGSVAGSAAPARPLVMRAYAAPAERDFPLGVARQLLEPVVKSGPFVRRWCSGPARPALAFLQSDPEAPRQHTPTTTRALLSMVENISHDRTPVLLVDDLHWADEGTLDWLDDLVQQVAHRRILVAVTVCEGEPAAEPPVIRPVAAAEYTLLPAPLAATSVDALILDHLGAPGDAEFTAACHDVTRGNPRYLVSLLQECRTHGIAPVAAAAPQVAGLVPPALRRRLLLSLREQPPSVLATARALLILGDDADRQVLGELAGLDPVDRDDSLRRLRRLGLITWQDGLRLAHRAVHEAIEDVTPPAERNRLHLAAAALLRYRGSTPEEVGGHLLATTAPLDDDAVAALRHAAGTAMHRGAPRTAARYLRRALRDALPHSKARARLLVELATVERSFAPSVAVRHIAQAFPLLPSPLARAEALTALTPVSPGTTLLSLGDLLRQTAQELAASEELPADRGSLELRLEARLRYLCENDPAVLASTLDRLASLGERPEMSGSGQRELLVTLLHSATASATLTAAEVGALARRVLDHEPASAAHVHTMLPLMVSVALSADSVAGLPPWLDTALQDAVRRGGRLEESVILSEQALVLLAQGRLTAARERAVKACSVVETEEVSTLSALALVMVTLRTREPELIGSLPEPTRGLYENCRLPGLFTLVRGLKAEQQHEPGMAVEHFLDAGYALERSGWRNPMLAPAEYWAARALHRMGEVNRAEQLSAQHLEQARAWGAPSGVGRALALQATVTGKATAPRLLREAAQVLEGSADLHARSMVLLQLAEAVASRHAAEAEAALRTSYELAVECGAPQVAARAQEMLGPAAVAVTAPARLTSAERMVAQMAVQGLTNQAIADTLGVSRRAVEKHLTSCYRKMSTSGRSGLADALEEAGLLDPAGEPPPGDEIRPQGVV